VEVGSPLEPYRANGQSADQAIHFEIFMEDNFKLETTRSESRKRLMEVDPEK
jgi:hypothetical protein